MIVENQVHYLNAYGNDIPSSQPYALRIGFWATVTEVNAKTNRVNVINDQGLTFTSIPLTSKTWVVDNGDYVSGEREIPPVNSRVFVLTPTGDISESFVLCSGYPFLEKSLQTLWAKNDSENKTKISQKEQVTLGGWNIKENYKDGNLSISSKDSNISIQLNLKDNDELKQKKGVTVKAWNNSVNITDDNLTVSDLNNNTIEFKKNSDGTKSIVINKNLEVFQ